MGQRAQRVTCGAFTTLLPTGDGHLSYDPTGLVKGWMVGRAGSVTVTGPTQLWADIWAPTLFVGGVPARQAFEADAVGYSAFTL